MQANAEGGLPERARERAIAVAEEADLRIRAPQAGTRKPRPSVAGGGNCPEPRIPRQDRIGGGGGGGFRYEEQIYRSLSAVAR
jgi:hypothetical protein